MLMKAGCSQNAAYVDRFSSSFVRVILRLAREHHSSPNVETIGVTELLTYCLDMLKNRVGVMKIDTRKVFIGNIITGLIERTGDAKLMKALCKVSGGGQATSASTSTSASEWRNLLFTAG